MDSEYKFRLNSVVYRKYGDNIFGENKGLGYFTKSKYYTCC